MVFTNIQEAVLAYQTGNVDIQSPIKCRHQGEIIETTVGRLIFNSFLPEEMPYLNEAMGKKKLSRTVAECFDNLGIEKTAKLADNLKHIGFKFATKSGISISQADMIVPDEKGKSIEEASEIVKQINNFYWKGLITDEERYNQTIKVWMQIKSSITKEMVSGIDNENNIFYMIDSGARGNWGQITQMCGMKGLVANPAGKTIELPISFIVGSSFLLGSILGSLLVLDINNE